MDSGSYCTHHELLLNFAQTFKTGLQLHVVVVAALGDRGYDSNVVSFGADVVC